MPSMCKMLISICLCMTIALGCNEAKKTKDPKPLREGKRILIGLIPEQNIFTQINQYKPLARYLSRKVGATIELKVLTRYGNIIDNFVSAGLDGAFFGSFTYALGHSRLGIEPVARPESVSGVSTYHGLIFVRKESGIKTPQDMKGKTFAFVDKATTAGYLLPLAYFRKHEIHDYQSFFKETYFAGTHENAIRDVLDKRADIGAAKNTVFDRLAGEDSRILSELTILEKSPDVPENGLALKKDLPASIKSKLKQELLNMHNDPEGINALNALHARKFIPTTDADYMCVYNYAKQIGLDLARYDYNNE